jgi:F420-dependent oxidoreductase-like protein
MIEAQEGLTWERWRRINAAAERLGFGSVWRSDHLVSLMGSSERGTPALWPSLTVTALETSTVEFGPLVCPTSFREPVHLAKEAVALDELSGGRFWLGMGAGWNEREHQMFGFPLLTLKERFDRFEEGLEVVKLLWSGETVNFDGQYYQLRNAQMRPTPSRPGGVPLMIGGGGEKRTLRLVARYADEWNVTSMPVDEYPAKVEVLRRHCREVGRDFDSIQRSWMVGHIIGRDESELLERAGRFRQINAGLRDASPQEILDRMRGRAWLVGTPDEIVEDLKRRAAMGIDRVMLQTHDQEDIAALELFASDVMPQIADA